LRGCACGALADNDDAALSVKLKLIVQHELSVTCSTHVQNRQQVIKQLMAVPTPSPAPALSATVSTAASSPPIEMLCGLWVLVATGNIQSIFDEAAVADLDGMLNIPIRSDDE